MSSLEVVCIFWGALGTPWWAMLRPFGPGLPADNSLLSAHLVWLHVPEAFWFFLPSGLSFFIPRARRCGKAMLLLSAAWQQIPFKVLSFHSSHLERIQYSSETGAVLLRWVQLYRSTEDAFCNYERVTRPTECILWWWRKHFKLSKC